jgi:hypothetical protein
MRFQRSASSYEATRFFGIREIYAACAGLFAYLAPIFVQSISWRDLESNPGQAVAIPSRRDPKSSRSKGAAIISKKRERRRFSDWFNKTVVFFCLLPVP